MARRIDRTAAVFNDNNVYILGAGFSRLAGLPLMTDFMFQMRDALEWHRSQGHVRAVNAISQVLEFRLSASSSAYRVRVDLENVEDLFSLAAATDEKLDEALRVAIASTILRGQARGVNCIAQFVSSDTPSFEIPPSWSKSPAPNNHWEVFAYDFIVKTLLGGWWSNERPHNTFITFNYDQLLERSLNNLHVPFSYGVKSLDSRIHAIPNAKLNVLKLHGSVNWAIPRGKVSEVIAFPDADSVIEDGLIPQLLPPTWRKDSLTTFSQIWRTALDAIGNATRLVIVGFSIPPTDLHFRYLLAAGLRNNISLREIVFVDPNATEIAERSKAIFANHEHNAARLRFEKKTIEAFCGQGFNLGCVDSIGRTLPSEIQNIAISRA